VCFLPVIDLVQKQKETLRRLQEQYAEIKSEIDNIGFVVQGSVTERWKKCGKTTCRCYKDPDEWHGPYYQWSWKSSGQTYSVSLTSDHAALCRQWVNNNRKLEKIIKRLRRLSLRVARLYKIEKK